jgi:adenylate cyclase
VSFKRKLTAILSADVEGYSRLMGEDEDATIRTLTAYRELMSTLIQKHRGRVVDSPGDNLLAEFLSVVDAVRCAVEIQEELRVRNAELSENRRMQFRIGINLGDVVQEEERIYGDGINIAARVEGLAEGGGICISGTVYDSIKNKLSLSYESLGEHTVKNIKEPVRVYRMRVGPEAAVKQKPKHWHKAALAALAVLIVAAGAWAIWNFYFRPPLMEPASKEKMAYPLPDKPSIAVLPFVNLSEDKNQEYFSDGITQNIITGLSKISNLFIIAGNSSFTFKGKPVKVQHVAEDLGVRYVLEGSVQKSGDRVRITAQLIDALEDRHIWSERYDRDLKEIFALQDEITMKIITALEVKLTEGEQARIAGSGTDNLDAYLKILQARDLKRHQNIENNHKARRLAEEAIKLDPDYAQAYRWLSGTHLMDVWLGSTKSPQESLRTAMELAKKALSLDDSLGGAHGLLGNIYIMRKDYEKGIREAERAVELEPNGADAHAFLGMALHLAGRPEEAIPILKKAIRLDPYAPEWYLHVLAGAYRDTEKYEEAIEWGEKAVQQNPKNVLSRVILCSIYSLAGRMDKASAQAKEIMRLNPKFSVERFASTDPQKNQAVKKQYIDALRKAGLPETPPLPLPDKPSIAVLPFVNMSDDPQQEYFSDGITEEIITALSKTPKLFVIARNSTFTYKGKAVKVQQIGRELGVKYVLEGSVEKSEDQVRITVQLVDAQTGHHLWAERYDRELKDIFALQDEITMKIITAMRVKLTEGEQARLLGKSTKNLEAYLKYLEGFEQLLRFNKEANARAKQLLEEAITLDPEFGLAYSGLGNCHWLDANYGWSISPSKSVQKAFELTQKALSLDDSLCHPHSLLGSIYILRGQREKAIDEAERAV